MILLIEGGTVSAVEGCVGIGSGGADCLRFVLDGHRSNRKVTHKAANFFSVYSCFALS